MRADQRKFHYIYKITRNDGSGKYYIGMHSTDDLGDGYFGSGKILWKSINKHGKENHSMQIIEFLSTRKELKSRERELVNEEIVNDPLCMNLQLGGGGGFISEDHRKKAQSKAAPIGGRTIFEKQIGMFSKESATKRKHTIKAKINSGELLPAFQGKNHSEETKNKIGLANSISMLGEKNSQFGTCWVTNGEKPIKIKKEDLDEYISNGYRRGRK